MKTFWFCCQSNPQVGLGHLSRLLAIAEELQSRGHVTCFSHYSTIDHRGKELLKSANFSTSCVCESSFNFLVIDSYELIFLNEIPEKSRVKVIQVVDDVSPNYIAIGYIQASPISNWKPMNLKGKVFSFDRNPILRKEYDNIKRRFHFGSRIEILISLGAVENKIFIIEKLLQVLNLYADNIARVNILDEKSIEFESNLSFNKLSLNWIHDSINFPTMIPPINYVISAAGVTAWEMIAIGVPGFIIAATNNQVQQLRYITDAGLRKGIQFLDQVDFQSSIKEIIEIDFKENFQNAHVHIRNGRVEVANWLDTL